MSNTNYEAFVMKETTLELKGKDGSTLPFKVKRYISNKDFITFAYDVAGECFDEELGYMPTIQDFCFRCAILAYYTDLELPESSEELYDLCYGTEIVDMVLDEISTAQVRSLRKSIRALIKDELFELRMEDDPAAKLWGALEGLLGKAAGLLEKVPDMMMDEEAMQTALEVMNKLEGVNQPTLAKAIVDASKIVPEA